LLIYQIGHIMTMRKVSKPLVWLYGEVKSPPFSASARLEAGILLRRLQTGEAIGLPHSRPMNGIAPHCHELRIRDEHRSWRIVYRLDDDAIVIVAVFKKTTRQTPEAVVTACRRRLRAYDAASGEIGGSGES
jgi:phage-related protein